MKRNNRHSRGTLPCESMGPEDGINSRDLFRGKSHKKSHHKTHQLCSQVMETINYLLAADLGDSRLQSVFVEEVVPAPDATWLLVTMRQGWSNADFGPSEIQEALNGAAGLIRFEVAAVVTRKKVPELVFQVLPTNGVPHE